jgi:energy-coupling factor transporter ATP-binding protein EcfA2
MDPTSVPASVEWSLFLLIFFILVLIGTLLKIPTWLEERRNRAAANSGAVMASDPPTLPYVIEPDLPPLPVIEPEPPQIAPRYRQINGIEIKPWRESMRERLALREERAAQARAAQERSARIQAILRNAHLPEISYAELAQGSDRNILIVGPKGSGKTTLLNRLIALRTGYVEAFDPHNEPGKWPCPVVGGGERFDGILRHLTAVYALMQERYQQSNAGTRSQASYQQPEWAITLVGDEWGGIVAELPSKGKTQLGAGAIQAKLLARGRKVGIGLLVAAHDDTAAQVGLEGEMGLLGCYDYIVYLGAQATSNSSIPKEVREEARAMQRPAVVLSTERQAWLKFSAIAHEPHAFDAHKWQRPIDYAAILDVQARSAVSNTADSVPNTEATIPNAEPSRNERRNGVLSRSDAMEYHSSQSVPPVPRSRSDAQVLAEALEIVPPTVAQSVCESAFANGNTDAKEQREMQGDKAISSQVVSSEELANIVQAVILYQQNGGRKADAICKAFGVTRGGGFAYRRAAWLVGEALDKMKPSETGNAGPKRPTSTPWNA